LYSHQTGLSYLKIIEISETEITIDYKKPLSDTRDGDISIHYPRVCSKPLLISHTIENGFILRTYKLDCAKQGLMNTRIWIDNLLTNDRGVLVEYNKDDFKQIVLLRAVSPFIHIKKESHTLELFREYIELGIEHILSGYDHLLFILALILLSPTLSKLLWSISGFTLAHSITLALGILGIVSVSILYIEAMIALSILFLARELLIQRSTFTKKNLGIVAFIFGLLHGFGFATVLKNIGLAKDDIALSLFAFNIGIELGQLFYIFILGTILHTLTKYLKVESKSAFAYFIGVFSAYWFIERLSQF